MELNESPNEKGYHLTPIPKGVFGEASKIIEETLEFQDAHQQGCTVMELLELADLYGAIQQYILRYNLTMADLATMSQVTERAFRAGERTPQ